MLENRSFDTVLGSLYPDGAPRGQSFEGLDIKNPHKYVNRLADGRELQIIKITDPHSPFKDPHEA